MAYRGEFGELFHFSSSCKYPGCSRPRYCEPYGFVHEFCGRTHATAYSQLTTPSQLASSNLKLKRPETSSQGSTKQGHSKPVIANHKFGNTDYLTKKSSALSAHRSVPKSNDIRFYHRDEPYYEFTNFAQYPIKLDGKRWPTTEHYFQAQKFIGTPYEEAIRKQHSARGAFDMSRNPSVFRWLRGDWEIVKKDIMLKCLRAKFTQHEALTQKLLATGDKKLVEHTTNDSYWGDGGDGSGLNMLGKLLMQVRKELPTTKTFLHQGEKSHSVVTPHKLLSEHKSACTTTTTNSVKYKSSGHRRSHSFSGTRSASLTNNNVFEKEITPKWSGRHSPPSITPTPIHAPSSSSHNLPTSKRFGSTGNVQFDRHNSLYSHKAPTSGVHLTDNFPTSKRFGSTGNISGSVHHTTGSNKASPSSRYSFGRTNAPKNKNGLKSYPPNDITQCGSHDFTRYGSHGSLNIITWKPLKYN